MKPNQAQNLHQVRLKSGENAQAMMSRKTPNSQTKNSIINQSY